MYAIITVKLKTEDYVGVKEVRRGWKSISERRTKWMKALE